MKLHQYLALLISEECHEVGQRATKLARFGLYEKQPGQDSTNRDRLQMEMNDLCIIYELLDNCTIAVPGLTNGVRIRKYEKLVKYTQYAVEQGSLPSSLVDELSTCITEFKEFHGIK